MKRIILPAIWLTATLTTIFASTFLLLEIPKSKAEAEENANLPNLSSPPSTGNFSHAIEAKDGRAQIVENFLRSKKSPLYPYSSYMVQVADQYGIDFRLLSAIAMKESGGGRAIPENSYNAWGWGIWDENSNLGFASWQEGIQKVAKGLKEEYYNKGHRTPEQIMQKYTPPSLEIGGPWARDVQQYLDEME